MTFIVLDVADEGVSHEEGAPTWYEVIKARANGIGRSVGLVIGPTRRPAYLGLKGVIIRPMVRCTPETPLIQGWVYSFPPDSTPNELAGMSQRLSQAILGVIPPQLRFRITSHPNPIQFAPVGKNYGGWSGL